MNAIIFYLTAFGYIDGEFDFTEKTFVRIYIRQLVSARAKLAILCGLAFGLRLGPARIPARSSAWAA